MLRLGGVFRNACLHTQKSPALVKRTRENARGTTFFYSPLTRTASQVQPRSCRGILRQDNGRLFRCSLLPAENDRFRCKAPRCIQIRSYARLSSAGCFLCLSPHPTSSLPCRCGQYTKVSEHCQEHISSFPPLKYLPSVKQRDTRSERSRQLSSSVYRSP